MIEYIPQKYGDDGQITDEYIRYLNEDEHEQTLAEQRWEAERDERICIKEHKK